MFLKYCVDRSFEEENKEGVIWDAIACLARIVFPLSKSWYIKLFNSNFWDIFENYFHSNRGLTLTEIKLKTLLNFIDVIFYAHHFDLNFENTAKLFNKIKWIFNKLNSFTESKRFDAVQSQKMIIALCMSSKIYPHLTKQMKKWAKRKNRKWKLQDVWQMFLKGDQNYKKVFSLQMEADLFAEDDDLKCSNECCNITETVENKFRFCSRCNFARYCSTECHHAHHKMHKYYCKRIHKYLIHD
jgi:hypothetical protein